MDSNTVKSESESLNDDNVTRLPVDNARDEGKEEDNRPDYLRDVTDHSDKDTSSLGSDLRTARKKLGEDIETIAMALNIRAAHLEALERGDISALPGRAYALGFVRSYASYLGLEADAAVTRFKLETDRQEEEAAALAFPEANEDIKMPQGSLTVIALLLVAAIIGGLQLSRMVDSMLTNGEQAAPIGEAEGSVAATTQPVDEDFQPPLAVEEVDIVGQVPIAAPSEGGAAVESEAPAETEPPVEAVTPEEVVSVEPPAQPSAPEIVAPAPEPAVDEQAFGADPGESRVSILANGDAWLRVDNPRSGAVLIQTTMRAGDRFFVPNEAGLVMAARNSRNLEIFVDGASIGPAGIGVLVEKSLDADQLISPAD